MAEVHFGRTATHFVKMFIFFYVFGGKCTFHANNIRKNVCAPKVCAPFWLLSGRLTSVRKILYIFKDPGRYKIRPAGRQAGQNFEILSIPVNFLTGPAKMLIFVG